MEKKIILKILGVYLCSKSFTEREAGEILHLSFVPKEENAEIGIARNFAPHPQDLVYKHRSVVLAFHNLFSWLTTLISLIS